MNIIVTVLLATFGFALLVLCDFSLQYFFPGSKIAKFSTLRMLIYYLLVIVVVLVIGSIIVDFVL